MNIIPFNANSMPPVQPQMKSPPDNYELFWVRNNVVMQISCSTSDQLIQQMNSLAARRIPATMFRNGIPCGFVGPNHTSRGGGAYRAYLIEA